MSGSSPESGEFAARHHLSLGFAFTNVPLAATAAAYYREQAAGFGWEPGPDDLLYRLSVHVADTDEQAVEDLLAAGAGERRGGLSTANRALDDAVAKLGYYGRDVDNQRGRLQIPDFNERIELGQLLVGSPETVLKQICSIRAALGCGILDLIFQPTSRDKTLKAIELLWNASPAADARALNRRRRSVLAAFVTYFSLVLRDADAPLPRHNACHPHSDVAKGRRRMGGKCRPQRGPGASSPGETPAGDDCQPPSLPNRLLHPVGASLCPVVMARMARRHEQVRQAEGQHARELLVGDVGSDQGQGQDH